MGKNNRKICEENNESEEMMRAEVKKYPIDGILRQSAELIRQAFDRGAKAEREERTEKDVEKIKEIEQKAYRRGLTDAWGAANQLFGGLSEPTLEELFPEQWKYGLPGLMAMEPENVVRILEEHKNRKKRARLSIGDVVTCGEDIAVIIDEVNEEGTRFLLLFENGCTDTYDSWQLVGTGGHFNQIDEMVRLMEEMHKKK